jgi:hypothetical protein
MEEEATDPAMPALPVLPVLPVAEIDSWDKLLAWGIELSGASAAFVVDSQGFVIASRGNVPEDGFVGAGAELCYAVEQLDRVEPESGGLRSVDIEFAGRRMTALRVTGSEGHSVITSFVVPRSLSDDLKTTLWKQAEYTLPLVV